MSRLTAIGKLSFFWLAAAAGPLLIANDNWPQFRGPTGDGHSDSQDVPLTWSETENVKWKTPVHGRAWSSPVVWGKQLWVTTATEDGHELLVICVDCGTGKILRDQKVFEVEKPQFCHQFNSYASPTPAIEEGRVYVTFGSPGTACLDTATAKVIWERRDFVCNHYRGAGSSPILYGDLLIHHAWVVIDDYYSPKEAGKALRIRPRVDALVTTGQLQALGLYGWGTWIGRWCQI